MVQITSDLLPRGSILSGSPTNYLNVSIVERPYRMLELARYYYFNNAITWPVWGSCGHINGTYSDPTLQELVNAYNSMLVKPHNHISGYFALMRGTNNWIAYYTPYNAFDINDTESIDVEITEADALLLATHLYSNGVIDVNHML